MNKKTKEKRKVFRKLAEAFSRLTLEEDQEIQDRVANEMPFTEDCDPDEIEAKQIGLAYQYATKLLYEKQCRQLVKC